jgi:preprotein translocase subunit YajC
MKKTFVYFTALIMTALSSAVHAAEGAAPQPEGSMWQMLIMISMAVFFFYIILWRPEQKRRKAAEEQRSSMQKGDKVTAMGIVGTVARVEEHTVILNMCDGGKIEFLKGAISDVIPAGSEEKARV